MDELYLHIIKGLQHLYFQSRILDRLDECNDEFVGAFESIYTLTKDKIGLTRNEIISYKSNITENKSEDKYYHAERATIHFQVFFKCCMFKVCKRNIIALRPSFDALIEYVKIYTKKSDSELSLLFRDKNDEFGSRYNDDDIPESEKDKIFSSFSRNIDISNIE